MLRGRPRRARPMANGRPKTQVNVRRRLNSLARAHLGPRNMAPPPSVVFYYFTPFYFPRSSHPISCPLVYMYDIMLYYYVYYNNRHGTHIPRCVCIYIYIIYCIYIYYNAAAIRARLLYEPIYA